MRKIALDKLESLMVRYLDAKTVVKTIVNKENRSVEF